MVRGRPCRWRSRLRRLGQSRRFQGAINTSSKDIEGKSARLLERHRQVEAFGPQLRDFAHRTGTSKWVHKSAAGGDAAGDGAIEASDGASGYCRRLAAPHWAASGRRSARQRPSCPRKICDVRIARACARWRQRPLWRAAAGGGAAAVRLRPRHGASNRAARPRNRQQRPACRSDSRRGDSLLASCARERRTRRPKDDPTARAATSVGGETLPAAWSGPVCAV